MDIKHSLRIVIVLLTGVYIRVEGQLLELLVGSVGNTGFIGGQEVKRIIDLPEDRLMILTDNLIHVISLRMSSDSSAANSYGHIHLVNTSHLTPLFDGLLLDGTQVLITNYNLHCLRAVNINNGDMRTYAGNCSELGTRDDRLLLARFSHPYGMLMVGKIIYVNSFRSTAIRLLFGKLVSTVQINYFNMVRTLLYMFSCDGTSSSITFSHGLVELDLTSLKPVVISGSVKAGFSDGNLVTSEFDNPCGVAMLGPSIILVADFQNNRLRIIDRSYDIVQSVCDGYPDSVDGNRRNCSFNKPFSVHLYKGIILIGELGKIRTIQRRAILNDVAFGIAKCSSSSTAATPSSTSQANRISKKNTVSLVVGIFMAMEFLALVAGVIYFLIPNFFTRKSGKVENNYNTKPVIDEQESQLQNIGSSIMRT